MFQSRVEFGLSEYDVLNRETVFKNKSSHGELLKNFECVVVKHASTVNSRSHSADSSDAVGRGTFLSFVILVLEMSISEVLTN